MNDTPGVLLQHYLKKLRLPTFLADYAKLASNVQPRTKTMCNISCACASLS